MNFLMRFKQLFFCALFCLTGVSVYAQKEDEVAKLSSATNDALDVLYEEQYSNSSHEEKAAAVRAILERDYDLMVLIRRTMGRNWKSLSSSEQSEVKELITQLIIKGFVNGLQGLERPTVTYGEQIMITEKRFEVPSVVTFSDGKVFNVVYRFGKLRTGWQIYDILAEEVSVVSNYRQQFDDHFRKGTGAELVDKLEDLLKKETIDRTTEL